MTAFSRRLAAVTALLILGGLCSAGALEQPGSRPILTISGSIGVKNAGETAQFDRAMLEAAGLVTVETTTPWYTGMVRFEGVPLAKLMEMVAAKGERAVAVALNDYRSEIPLDDFSKYNVILALKRDGQYMSVRDKGPLFIIYPYDSRPELKSQNFYSRSAWQVTRIEIK